MVRETSSRRAASSKSAMALDSKRVTKKGRLGLRKSRVSAGLRTLRGVIFARSVRITLTCELFLPMGAFARGRRASRHQ